MLEVTDVVLGTKELIGWFGYWPSFHDAEVLDVKFDRNGPSQIRIHTFEVTDRVDKQGHYVCTKHIVISFVLTAVMDLHLDNFNNQNVISGLSLRQKGESYELVLEPCYGVQGTISAQAVRLELQPGIPPGSNYWGANQD